jgi:exodeoxyribonuclease V gamma subunit
MLKRMPTSAAPPATPPQDPMTHWPTGFMVLHGNRLEDLRQLLIEHVRQFPLEGLNPEWVVVQSNGMKQWLEQGLASPQGLGICAATRMVFPAEMLWHAYRTVLGPDQVPQHMPLDREHLVWRLMRLLPEMLARDNEGVFDALTGYVRGTNGQTDDARLLQLCQQLAGLYDGYQNYRADWLRLWAAHHDQLSDAQGLKQDIPPGERWQACLWRELLNDVAATQKAAPELPPSRAEVHQAFLRQMAQQQPAGLPKRVLVFGVSAMPMQSIEALAALGRVSQVMVFVLNPCQHHWGHVVSERQMLQAVARTRQKLKHPPPSGFADAIDWHTQAQPLLAAWGQQGRDYLHLLDVHDDTGQYRHLLDRIDLFEDPLPQGAGAQATRLQRLQSDILNLNPVPASRYPVAPGDDSFVLVKAHSAVREIELLHDRILGWLEADPELRPREIIVMVPDMSRFAPLIHAVWGRFAQDDPRRIAYSVADQSAKDHPMAAIVEALLQGPSARLTLDDWLSWLEVPAFARACGFPTEELFAVRDVLKDVGVRWGLDGAHRVSSGVALSETDATPNTWLFGLQRLLLAQAQGPQSGAEWQGIWPAEAPTPMSEAALNALCASLQTLTRVLQTISSPRTPGSWVRDLHAMIAAVLVAKTEVEQRTLLALSAPLNAWLASCQVAGLDTPVSLTVVRSHWISALSDTGSGNRFLSGGVQFATLMPMRSIPFKRVCLLGMNDGQYPRRQPLTDFDLMRAPGMRRPGDRSRREDDRFLFLEALLCARQQVYISWQGWQTTDQSRMYPSVLVGQLIDHLNAAHTDPIQVHSAPMQSFSRQYFERPDSNWRTYAVDWALARGWSGHPDAPKAPPSEAADVPTSAPEVLRLGSLTAMLRQPLDVFYVHRLGMGIQTPEEELPDAEPFDLGPLALYGLVETALNQTDPEGFVARARASGLLPLGSMALRPLRRLDSQAKALSDRRNEVLQTVLWQPLNEQTLLWRDPQAAEGQTPIEVTGTIGGCGWHTDAHGQLMQIALRPGALTKSKVPQAYPLLNAWSGHVLANACGLTCTTHWIGLGETRTLAPLTVDQAYTILQQWLAAYRSAWADPIVLPGRTACLWLASTLAPGKETDLAKRQKKAHAEARSNFMGSKQNPREAERLSVAMMRRHALDYHEVAPVIETWAPVLYGDLLNALMPVPNGSDATPDGGMDD